MSISCAAVKVISNKLLKHRIEMRFVAITWGKMNRLHECKIRLHMPEHRSTSKNWEFFLSVIYFV